MYIKIAPGAYMEQQDNGNKDKNSRFKPNPKYFTIGVYTVIVFALCAIIARLVFSWSAVWHGVRVFIGVLSPFIVGAIIAYLINPLYKFLDFTFFGKWLRMTKKRKLRKVLSLLVSYIIVFGIIVLIISFVVPQLVSSIASLIDAISGFAATIQTWITDLQEHFINLNLDFLDNWVDSFIPSLTELLKNWSGSLVSTAFSTSVSVVSGVVKGVLAIIVSIYMLSDKLHLERSLRNAYYAFFRPERAAVVARISRESSNIFSNFFTGKIFDSLIVGVLCFLGMLILRLPYALLIAVVVGVTNIIPYFGPFIGAIPSILILLMTGWKEAIIFTIFILILQQVDGNLIGPRILGNSIGLRPIWVVFAITIGGWVGGVIGMVFGIPIFAVLGNIIQQIVTRRLKTKGLDSMIVYERPKPQTIKYSEVFTRFFKKKKKGSTKQESEEDSDKDTSDDSSDIIS